jgi:hypothetical protein
MTGVLRITDVVVQAWRRGIWPALAALAIFTWLFMPEPVDPDRCSRASGDCWSAGFVTTTDSQLAFASALSLGLLAAALVLVAVAIGAVVLAERSPVDAD